MKKFISIIILSIVLVAGCISAFATKEIGTAISAVKDNEGNIKVSEIDQDGKLTAYITPCYEEEKYVMKETCPVCGSTFYRTYHKDVERIDPYTESGEYTKFVDLKGKALYFVTPKNELMLINLVTKEQIHICDNVKGLIRIGMNGHYIAYVTTDNKSFAVPYEIKEDGVLDAEYTAEFGE